MWLWFCMWHLAQAQRIVHKSCQEWRWNWETGSCLLATLYSFNAYSAHLENNHTKLRLVQTYHSPLDNQVMNYFIYFTTLPPRSSDVVCMVPLLILSSQQPCVVCEVGRWWTTPITRELSQLNRDSNTDHSAPSPTSEHPYLAHNIIGRIFRSTPMVPVLTTFPLHTVFIWKKSFHWLHMSFYTNLNMEFFSVSISNRTFMRSLHLITPWTSSVCGWCWLMKGCPKMKLSVPPLLQQCYLENQMVIVLQWLEIWHWNQDTFFSSRYSLLQLKLTGS